MHSFTSSLVFFRRFRSGWNGWILAAACFLWWLPGFLPAAEFYVALDGADAHPGTREQPFATLERGRDAVRELKKQGTLPAGGATVYLRGGLYLRAASFTLGAEDSGTREAPITYAAAPGEVVRLAGAISLDGAAFAKVQNTPEAERFSPASRWLIWKLDLKGVPKDFPGPFLAEGQWGLNVTPSESELFANGQRMTICRWPNHGDLLTEALDLKRTEQWNAPQEIMACGSDKWIWKGVLKRLSFPLVMKELPSKGFYFFNVPEELDMAGEYYLDPVGRKLFVIPPTATPKAVKEFLLSTLATPVIEVRGASHVVLRGLQIEASRGSGIVVEGGDHNSVSDCAVVNVGMNGIRIAGTQHSVLDCVVRDVGAHGIQLEGGDPATGRHSGNVVAGCEIVRPGRRTGRANILAISLKGVGHTISHNEIHDVVRSAVEIRGYHNIYEHNEVYDVVQEVYDNGGFYGGTTPTWGTCGNIFRSNYLHGIKGVSGHLTASLYADCDTTAGFVVGNVFTDMRNAGGEGVGIMINGGRLNAICGNLFLNIDSPIRIDRGSNLPSESEAWMVKPYLEMVAKNPLFEKYPYSQEPAQVPKESWDKELTQPRYNVITGNAFVACGEMVLSEDVAKYGVVGGNQVYPTAAAAGLIGDSHRDYLLPKDAPIFRDLPGFPAIPFRQMGRAGRFDPLLLEFEDFDMSGGSCIPAMEEGIFCGKSAGGTGTGCKEFRGDSGTYDLTVRFKDAKGGSGLLTVSVAGKQVASWKLDKDDGTWHERPISGVKLRAGDEIQVVCEAQGEDAACVDSIRLERINR